MAEIVKKSADEAHRFLVGIDGDERPEPVDHFAGGFHHAEAMAISRMVSTGIGEAGEAELANAPQSLHLRSVEETEEESFEGAIGSQDNHIMDRIANDFLGHEAISKWPARCTRYKVRRRRQWLDRLTNRRRKCLMG